jgi:hypothetical protein
MALTAFALAFPVVSSVTEGIVATPSGTQATGVQLTTRYNSLTTVATSGDSVILPPWQTDIPIYVSNDGAAAAGVYPTVGQQIGSAAINAVFLLTAGKTAIFVGAGTTGKWRYVLSA